VTRESLMGVRSSGEEQGLGFGWRVAGGVAPATA
jgi:hypothetical protein